jgi:hypothetical protein
MTAPLSADKISAANDAGIPIVAPSLTADMPLPDRRERGIDYASGATSASRASGRGVEAGPSSARSARAIAVRPPVTCSPDPGRDGATSGRLRGPSRRRGRPRRTPPPPGEMRRRGCRGRRRQAHGWRLWRASCGFLAHRRGAESAAGGAHRGRAGVVPGHLPLAGSGWRHPQTSSCRRAGPLGHAREHDAPAARLGHLAGRPDSRRIPREPASSAAGWRHGSASRPSIRTDCGTPWAPSSRTASAMRASPRRRSGTLVSRRSTGIRRSARCAGGRRSRRQGCDASIGARTMTSRLRTRRTAGDDGDECRRSQAQGRGATSGTAVRADDDARPRAHDPALPPQRGQRPPLLRVVPRRVP